MKKASGGGHGCQKQTKNNHGSKQNHSIDIYRESEKSIILVRSSRCPKLFHLEQQQQH